MLAESDNTIVIDGNHCFPPDSLVKEFEGPYFFGFGSGTVIRKIVVDEFEASDFPQTLLDTGCFDSQNPTVALAGLIPYSVNAPLWSDGAKKERHLAIPDRTTISVGSKGDWTFPKGSVLVVGKPPCHH